MREREELSDGQIALRIVGREGQLFDARETKKLPVRRADLLFLSSASGNEREISILSDRSTEHECEVRLIIYPALS